MKRGLNLGTRMSESGIAHSLSRCVITLFKIFFFLTTNILKVFLQNLRQCHCCQNFYILFVLIFCISQGPGRKQTAHKAGNWGELNKETRYKGESRVKGIKRGTLSAPRLAMVGSSWSSCPEVAKGRRIYRNLQWGSLVVRDNHLTGGEAFRREMKATMKNKYSELILLSPISLQPMLPRGQVSPLTSKAKESLKGVPRAQSLYSTKQSRAKKMENGSIRAMGKCAAQAKIKDRALAQSPCAFQDSHVLD